MNVFAFEALHVTIQLSDGEFELVGFADGGSDPKIYLILQRALEFDEQDISLGMDTYYVEWRDPELSGYGGIFRIKLSPNAIEVEFNPKGVNMLGGLERLTISFQLLPPHFEVMRQALGRIFERTGCLDVSNA